MRAFVMKEIGQVGLMDKDVPRPGPLDAVVKTTTALICTSDSHTVKGGIGPRQNLTLGHEGVGVVHEVGDEVRTFRPGDRVLVGAITPPTGATWPRRTVTRRSPAGRSAGSSSPTPRTASSPSTST
ncbi:alcohol dehydrogenase catalytic domain-containing protein [Nonomuraea salmonea]|uniref:alcohol dehydrogenase catalytic domain-containing protein n=1 Tax=Nonomuraea salmonea TaxID=46181 RepID=UPI002FE795A2